MARGRCPDEFNYVDFEFWVMAAIVLFSHVVRDWKIIMASDCRQMVVHSYNHSVSRLAYILNATFCTRDAVDKICAVATDLSFCKIGAASGVAFDPTRGIETRTVFASIWP